MTMVQPSTSWCCPNAMMKPSSWRSSMARWKSMQTSSVSPSIDVSKNIASFELVCSVFYWFSHNPVSVKVQLVECCCVLTRPRGNAGGLPEHCSVLRRREETPAGRQVLSEVRPVQQSKSCPHSVILFTLNPNFRLVHMFRLWVSMSVCLSGPEPLPEVSQHRWQPGCWDGYRDSEHVVVNIQVQIKNLLCMCSHLNVCVRMHMCVL